jgi:ankyrin repeat protein
VKLLIERGAQVDAKDANGRTALMLAVRACVDSFWTDWRKPDSVAALLAAGASTAGVGFPSGYGEVDELLRRAGARG